MSSLIDTSGLAQRRLALLGNPNCGKTALFNRLTGSQQKVGNYAGVTVELKRGLMKTAAGRSVTVIDLPGTYSLNAGSQDEAVACAVVLGHSLSELKLRTEHGANVVGIERQHKFNTRVISPDSSTLVHEGDVLLLDLFGADHFASYVWDAQAGRFAAPSMYPANVP